MQLQYKPDLDRVRRYMAAFWAGGADLKRPAMQVTVPKTDPPAPKPPHQMLGLREDPDEIADAVLRWAAGHHFLAEAVPFYGPLFGPEHFAGLLGCPLYVHPDSPDTVWSEPFVEDWDDVELRFDRGTELWERTVCWIRRLRRRLDGRVLVTAPSLSANLDALAAVRDPQRLAIDLAAEPEKVRRALEQVATAHAEVIAALRDELDVDRWGTVNRHGLYCEGMTDVLQSDFSCMISEAMFGEFVLPYLRREADALAGAVYHLDGPDAIRHLEAICTVEDIQVIQWVPGAAGADQDWSDLQRRIDELRKGQFFYVGADEARRVCREYTSRQIVLFSGWLSLAQAETLLESLDG